MEKPTASGKIIIQCAWRKKCCCFPRLCQYLMVCSSNTESDIRTKKTEYGIKGNYWTEPWSLFRNYSHVDVISSLVEKNGKHKIHIIWLHTMCNIYIYILKQNEALKYVRSNESIHSSGWRSSLQPVRFILDTVARSVRQQHRLQLWGGRVDMSKWRNNVLPGRTPSATSGSTPPRSCWPL